MEVSEQIIKVLDYIGEKVGIAIDWTAETVMPYIKELCGRFITYNIVENIMTMIICLIFSIAIIIIGYKLFKKGLPKIFKYDITSWEVGLVFYGIGGGVGEILTIIFFFTSLYDLIKWIILPELQFITFIQDFLNGGI